MKVIPAKTSEYVDAVADQSHLSIDSMNEYGNLKFRLLIITLILSGVICLSVWLFYSLDVALNYLLGACVGMVYLRMLAKSVDRLDQLNQRSSFNRMGIFIILMIVAARWEQLSILPVFLGFMTYKAAVLVYLAQDLVGDRRST